MTATVEFDGTVTSYNWRNPHVYFNVERLEADGSTREWELQMPSTVTMTRMGWSRDSLVPGDRVTVFTHVARDGRPYGILEYATKADGTVLATSFDYGSGSVDPVFDIGGASEHGLARRHLVRRPLEAHAVPGRIRRFLSGATRADRGRRGGAGIL